MREPQRLTAQIVRAEATANDAMYAWIEFVTGVAFARDTDADEAAVIEVLQEHPPAASAALTALRLLPKPDSDEIAEALGGFNDAFDLACFAGHVTLRHEIARRLGKPQRYDPRLQPPTRKKRPCRKSSSARR